MLAVEAGTFGYGGALVALQGVDAAELGGPGGVKLGGATCFFP